MIHRDLIHRGAVPLPREDSEELGVRSEELLRSLFEDTLQISDAAIAYCLLPIAFKYRASWSLVPGPWSLVTGHYIAIAYCLLPIAFQLLTSHS